MRNTKFRLANPASSLSWIIQTSVLSPVALLAFAGPFGAAAVVASFTVLAFPVDAAVVRDGILTVAIATPATSIATIVAVLVLTAGTAFGAASASAAVAVSSVGGTPTVRHAWRAAGQRPALRIGLAGVTAVALIAAGAGLVVSAALGTLALVLACVLIGLGVIFMAHFLLALPVGMLVQPNPFRAIGSTLRVMRFVAGGGAARASMLMSLAVAAGLVVGAHALLLLLPAGIGWAMLIAFGTALVTVLAAVFSVGVITGFAVDGLERASIEIPAPAAAAVTRRTRGRILLVALAAVAAAPLVTTGLTALNPIGHAVVTVDTGFTDHRNLRVTSFGTDGALVLSGVGNDLHNTGMLTGCGAVNCTQFTTMDTTSTDIGTTPSGDVLFARWAPVWDERTNNTTSENLTVTALTPNDLRESPGEHDTPVGIDGGPGTSSVIDRLPESAFPRPRPGSHNNHETAEATRVTIDTSGEVPMVAVVTRPVQHELGVNLTLLRCADEVCSSASPVATTSLDWIPPVGPYGAEFDLAMAADGTAFITLEGAPTEADPLRLVVIDPDGQVTVRSLFDPFDEDFSLHYDETSGSRVAVNGNGTATIAWRSPVDSSLSLITCDDAECTTRSAIRFAQPKGATMLPTLAVDKSGIPMFAGYDWYHKAAVLISCDDVACTRHVQRTLATVDFPGGPLGLSLDAEGRPIVVAGVPTYNFDGLWSKDSRTQVVHCAQLRCGAS